MAACEMRLSAKNYPPVYALVVFFAACDGQNVTKQNQPKNSPPNTAATKPEKETGKEAPQLTKPFVEGWPEPTKARAPKPEPKEKNPQQIHEVTP